MCEKIKFSNIEILNNIHNHKLIGMDYKLVVWKD